MLQNNRNMTLRELLIEAFEDQEHGHRFFSKEIKEMVLRLCNTFSEGSIIPSDYCYNIVNKGQADRKYCLFVQVEPGLYEYKGLNFQYSGDVTWKGRLLYSLNNGVRENVDHELMREFHS
jgi:hypothetical protein